MRFLLTIIRLVLEKGRFICSGDTEHNWKCNDSMVYRTKLTIMITQKTVFYPRNEELI